MRVFWLILLLAAPIWGQSQHQVVEGWPRLPEGHELGLCAGVDVDAQNRVFVFHRSGRKWSNPFPKEPIEEPTVSIFDGVTLYRGRGCDRCRG